MLPAYADENIIAAITDGLRRRGMDIVSAEERGQRATDDEVLLQTAAGEGRALVSFDRGFTNVIQHPPGATAGIVVVRLREQTLPRVRQVAATLAGLLATERIQGRLWVLDESRLRIWPRVPG